MKNLLITMSGGTTTVINSTLAGVISTASKSKVIDKIYLGVPGILGVLNGNIIDVTNLNSKKLSLLKQTPSSCPSGTTRVKKMNKKEISYFKNILSDYNIDFFINIGGNGTIKQSKHISKEIPLLNTISLPKTVDNDFGDPFFKDVYFTPGFPSVVNYWMHKIYMMNLENIGAHSHDKVLIAQTFGRKTGFIAGGARIADIKRDLPLLILLPEDQQSIGDLFKKIKETISEYGRAIIVMSEGYKIGDIKEVKDYSKQIMYGSSKNLGAQLLVNECMKRNIQARAFIPGFDQRSEIMFSLKYDIEKAFEIGKYAIKEIEKGHNNFLASICKSNKEVSYKKIHYSDFDDYSRKLDNSFLIKGGYDVSDKYVEYLKEITKKREHVKNGPLDWSDFLLEF